MNQQKDIIRDARVLGTPKMLLLGLQHMFAMFGATILVPILVNSYFQSTSQVLSVQVTLFCAGFGTLFFHLCTKFKVPAFLGSSFAFLGGFSSVAALDTGIFANMADKEKLQYACGGIVVAGLLYLILALIIRCVGVKRVMRFLPPVVTGPIIIWTEPCTVCGQQCIHKLAHCNCGTGGHHYFQYLGKRNVQDYSDSSRCSDFVCVRTGSAGTWFYESGRICYFKFFRRFLGGCCRTSTVYPAEI